MSSDQTQAAPGVASDFTVTHPLRPQLLAGALSWALFSVASTVTALVARPHVDPQLFWPWLAFDAAFLVMWVGFVIAMAIRQPDAEESVRLWGNAARAIIYGSNIVVVWGIAIIMPALPVDMRLMMTVLFVAYTPTQIVCSPENVVPIRVATVTVSGALALFFVAFADPAEPLLALFIAGFGAVMFVFCDVNAKAVAQTVAARLESDEAARRLEVALEQVAAERDAKTRFIAAASHDLGQPLQAANLFFSQMERTKDASHRTQAAEGVRRAFSSAEQLLSHMLNHLRLEADAVDPHSSVMSVGDAIARAAAQFAPAAQDAGIALKAVKTRQLLFADKVLVDRALGNLVDNAIRHSGAKRILIGARRIGRERLRLYVIDDGVGIPPAEAECVFDDYFTGSESRAITRSGFGLGLSSVRRIAALLDGTVAIDRRWRRGAAFVLDFPSIASAAVRVKKGRVSA